MNFRGGFFWGEKGEAFWEVLPAASPWNSLFGLIVHASKLSWGYLTL